MSIVRTFIAIECSGGVASKAVSLVTKLKPSGAKVAWVPAEQMHWTLKFLGDLDLTQSHAICKAVAEVAKDFSAFDVVVRGLGAFPNAERPRTLWLGVEEGFKEFVDLVDRLDERLAQAGFRPEKRRYTPHLTLGRVRSSQNIEDLAALVAKHADFEAGTMYVEDITVYCSSDDFDEDDEKGYVVLGHIELKREFEEEADDKEDDSPAESKPWSDPLADNEDAEWDFEIDPNDDQEKP